MKQNHHFIVPRERFVLLTGESLLSTYTFNTHAAKSDPISSSLEENIKF